MLMVDCPVCNGSCRRPAGNYQYKELFAGYDKVTDTLPCTNCGAQTMSGKATGKVRAREGGTPCLHAYNGVVAGNCYHVYTCIYCGDWYDIDSSG